MREYFVNDSNVLVNINELESNLSIKKFYKKKGSPVVERNITEKGNERNKVNKEKQEVKEESKLTLEETKKVNKYRSELNGELLTLLGQHNKEEMKAKEQLGKLNGTQRQELAAKIEAEKQKRNDEITILNQF